VLLILSGVLLSAVIGTYAIVAAGTRKDALRAHRVATDANLDGTVSGRELKAWLNEEVDVSQDKSVKSLGDFHAVFDLDRDDVYSDAELLAFFRALDHFPGRRYGPPMPQQKAQEL
jgi:hypothetical protein